MNYSDLKLYIAVHDDVPDFIVPTLVAHSVLANHCDKSALIQLVNRNPSVPSLQIYLDWLNHSFKKVVLRVNQKEFDKIAALPDIKIGHENKTMDGKPSCIIVNPRQEYPNVLKYARMWKPKEEMQ